MDVETLQVRSLASLFCVYLNFEEFTTVDVVSTLNEVFLEYLPQLMEKQKLSNNNRTSPRSFSMTCVVNDASFLKVPKGVYVNASNAHELTA